MTWATNTATYDCQRGRFHTTSVVARLDMAARMSGPLATAVVPSDSFLQLPVARLVAAAAWSVVPHTPLQSRGFSWRSPPVHGASEARSDSESTKKLGLSAGDEALEAELRDGNAPDAAQFVAFTDNAESSDSDSEEPVVVDGNVGVAANRAANEPLGAAASLVPGRTYGRLKINLDILHYKARCARRVGRGDEAEALLRECLRDWPDDGRAYVALGTSLVRQGKIQEARKLYEDGCQAARGENPYIWQAWAVLEERNGNIAKARSLFDAATVADKKHAAAWHGWAVLELRNENLKKTRTLLLKGLKYCGQNEYLYQTFALLEVRTGEIEQARSYFAKATQVNPNSAASWLAWALMEAEFGIKDAVRRLLQRGLQAVPKSRYIWQAWARFEAKEGNRKRARELFQRGIELNPRDVVLVQAYALFEYECGQSEVARGNFRRAVLIDPRHQPLWLAWGWTEWKQGKVEAAREYYQRSLMINNRNMNAVRTYQAWGVLEGKEGNYAAARALFRSALRLDSQNMPAWMSWAAMEERCGNAVRAEELRTQCLQQKTEVVEEAPWDVNFSDLLGPTIEGLTGLISPRQRKKRDDSSSSRGKHLESLNQIEDAESKKWGSGDNFDIDAFLQEKFPWKYKSGARKSNLQNNNSRSDYSRLVKSNVTSRT